MAVEFNIGITKCVVLNVYIPYQCAENEEKYLEYLGGKLMLSCRSWIIHAMLLLVTGMLISEMSNILYLLPTC